MGEGGGGAQDSHCGREVNILQQLRRGKRVAHELDLHIAIEMMSDMVQIFTVEIFPD